MAHYKIPMGNRAKQKQPKVAACPVCGKMDNLIISKSMQEVRCPPCNFYCRLDVEPKSEIDFLKRWRKAVKNYKKHYRTPLNNSGL